MKSFAKYCWHLNTFQNFCIFFSDHFLLAMARTGGVQALNGRSTSTLTGFSGDHWGDSPTPSTSFHTLNGFSIFENGHTPFLQWRSLAYLGSIILFKSTNLTVNSQTVFLFDNESLYILIVWKNLIPKSFIGILYWGSVYYI